MESNDCYIEVVFKELLSIIFVFANVPKITSIVCKKWREVQANTIMNPAIVSCFDYDKRYDWYIAKTVRLDNEYWQGNPKYISYISRCAARFIKNESYDAIIYFSIKNAPCRTTWFNTPVLENKLEWLEKLFDLGVVDLPQLKYHRKLMNKKYLSKEFADWIDSLH